MSELRQNMATKQWVIIATERARRPEEFVDRSHRPHAETMPVYDPSCPFCPGNEEGPDMEFLRLPQGSEHWLVRVVRNKFPALRQDGQTMRQFDGVHRSINGVGYHEVVIEFRIHNLSPGLAPVEDVSRILMAFQMRGVVMALDDCIEHVIYFKNHGVRGALRCSTRIARSSACRWCRTTCGPAMKKPGAILTTPVAVSTVICSRTSSRIDVVLSRRTMTLWHSFLTPLCRRFISGLCRESINPAF